MKPIAQLPRVLVEFDGKPLHDSLSASLVKVYLRRRLSAPALCELTFANPEDGDDLAFLVARESKLRLVLAGDGCDFFSGAVIAVEFDHGPSNHREVMIRAYDALHALRERQSVRAHNQMTLCELARELVADLGLEVEATEQGPLRQQVVQHRQSDFDLLREQADLCGLYFILRDDVLHLLTLEGIDEPVTLTLGESLLEARVELNRRRSSGSVHTQGWDAHRVDEHSGVAETPRGGREIVATVGEESRSTERTFVNETVENSEQALALAQGVLDQQSAAEVVLRGVAEGDSRLTPGTRLKVQGLGRAIAGQYVLSEVKHVIDTEGGFLTEISTDPPPRAPRPTSASVALARVTAVDDPDNLARVRVALPSYGNVETEWIPVVIPAAGQGKGIIALPDVDDDVLVALPPENPAMAVVLGGLYGQRTPPLDAGIEGGRTSRYTFSTPGGQKMTLDDDRGSTVLENSAGSRIEFSPDGVSLHANADLVIEAPGQVLRIRASKIDFEEV